MRISRRVLFVQEKEANADMSRRLEASEALKSNEALLHDEISQSVFTATEVSFSNSLVTCTVVYRRQQHVWLYHAALSRKPH